MKIAHLASFSGNIGDNASHLGLYEILNRKFGNNKFSIQNIEIRRFYKNYTLPDKCLFDESFVSYVNQFNLLIVGGGGFLDYWISDSKTGTTIDIDESTLNKIKIPIVFAGVGSLPHKEVPEGNTLKFKLFLDTLLQNKNVCVGLRNDGSFDHLKNLFGSEFSSKMYKLLDNAFFYQSNTKSAQLIDSEYIIINTTDDQLFMTNRLIGQIDREHYVNELRKIINYIIKNTNFQILFVPHIYNDLKAIDYVLDGVEDFYKRSRIIISPYVSGFYGTKFIMSLYKKSSLNIAMRYHSNVCSIAQGSPTIGLVALDRVIHMYESVGLTENEYIRVDMISLQEFINKFELYMESKGRILAELNSKLESVRSSSLEEYGRIFSVIGF